MPSFGFKCNDLIYYINVNVAKLRFKAGNSLSGKKEEGEGERERERERERE
jgi:hypothetical protein